MSQRESDQSKFGSTPTRPAENARVIRYGFARTSLGLLLVAASEAGVCRIAFGGDEEELARLMLDEFPFARLARRDQAVARYSDAVVRYVDGRDDRLDLPLDVCGSRFQRRVWSALGRIPRGETRSYGAIAKEVGVPAGARAVARACAANPVALAIPCHRVVPAAGGPGGYRWGAERKRLLLERECEDAAGYSVGPTTVHK